MPHPPRPQEHSPTATIAPAARPGAVPADFWRTVDAFARRTAAVRRHAGVHRSRADRHPPVDARVSRGAGRRPEALDWLLVPTGGSDAHLL